MKQITQYDQLKVNVAHTHMRTHTPGHSKKAQWLCSRQTPVSTAAAVASSASAGPLLRREANKRSERYSRIGITVPILGAYIYKVPIFRCSPGLLIQERAYITRVTSLGAYIC